ncbi:hypothetical protein [Acinetobacter johnsonii]|uniref:hypothetical protein n=1 Tax=Acinetobacter johnsonii TaxID=40214 RepID=UPI002936B0D2|nr:hypothetical protein [Acinetobacter johnsonii]MDV2486783.1 hypothetical protein [Acinetobacter johnsonii]MDV2486793.1 hypothetical protein [Acinetobacter johnsonii]
MVARWLLGFTLALQVTFAVASDLPANPRDDTPAQSLKRLQNHFSNQASYDLNNKRAASEMVARVQMGAPNSAERARVEQLLTRSGVALDGSKATITAKVSQPANTAKVASAITERLKNAKNYAKNVGKASIPTFVGMAAFHGLMEGIGWVMDEGGKVTKTSDENSQDELKYTSQYTYRAGGGVFYSIEPVLKEALTSIRDSTYISYSLHKDFCVYTSDCRYATFTVKYKKEGINQEWNFLVERSGNPDYKPDHVPEASEATPEQIETALKNALESNNPALASAIAEAIKSAYSNDSSPGQTPSANTLVADAQKDMTSVRDKAFDNPTPTSTRDKPEGYYKITDGDKTIEGYVTPSDTTSTGTTDSTTTTNPDGSTTTTGTTAQEWPAFCDWAGIVCEFIDWVKEDEQIKEDEPEELDDSIFDREFDIEFNMGAACPPNPIWKFDFVGHQWSKEIDITSVCDFFKYLGYAIVFASNMTALWIVYAAVTVREQA